MASATSDVRQCTECGKYLVLSRHGNAETKPVETKKSAFCRDCFYTKPEEWDSYPPFLKKSGFVKCWRVMPAESVLSLGHRCHRWISERFDPNSEEPAEKTEREQVRELAPPPVVSKETEHKEKMSAAAKKRVPKYAFTDEMLQRAKELRTQDRPLSTGEALKTINKEFSTGYADNAAAEASFYSILTTRFPELKGIKVQRGGRKKETPRELAWVQKKDKKAQLELAKAQDEVASEDTTPTQEFKDKIARDYLDDAVLNKRFDPTSPGRTVEEIARNLNGAKEADKKGLDYPVPTKEEIVTAVAQATAEKLKDALENGVVTEGPGGEIEGRMPVNPVKDAGEETLAEYRERISRPGLEFDDLNWDNIRKANTEEIELPEIKAETSVLFGIETEYTCRVKSVNKDHITLGIPELGELQLRWNSIRCFFVPEPDEERYGSKLLDQKIREIVNRRVSEAKK